MSDPSCLPVCNRLQNFAPSLFRIKNTIISFIIFLVIIGSGGSGVSIPDRINFGLPEHRFAGIAERLVATALRVRRASGVTGATPSILHDETGGWRLAPNLAYLSALKPHFCPHFLRQHPFGKNSCTGLY
jgi:hypothetical protein